jgi:glutamine synthetase type III
MMKETTAKAPTPAQVDALVSEYAKAKSDSDAAATVAKVAGGLTDEVKGRLVTMVEAFGTRHAEKSKRLKGLHNTATTTTATRVTVDDTAVETFRGYLDKQELVELSGRFFVAHTTYTLVEGPAEVLKTLSLPKRIREKIASLIGLCFQIKTNAPSLKVETVEPVVP